MPALARLAQLHTRVDASFRPQLATTLRVADAFVGELKREDFRREARLVEDLSKVQPESRFASMREQSKRLQEALERLFFDSELLRQRARRYMSF